MSGWYLAPNARKFHAYGDDGRSLCGRYAVLVLPRGLDPLDAPASKDDCAECRRRADRRFAKPNLR